MAIEYITNENIDFKKWNRCIRKAFNGNIYAYSWYLDIVSEKWNALVENDYEKVMPLPHSKLGGSEIIVHPKFAGQLGIFSTTTLNERTITNFVNAIPDKFSYVNLKLNKHNKLANPLKSTKLVNLDIDLIKPYNKLHDIYPDYLKDLLSDSYRMNFNVVTKIPVDTILKFENNHSPVYAYFHPEEIITKQLLVAAALNNNMGQICGLYNGKKDLLALAFFVWSHQKATLIFQMIHNKKLQLNALFFLIDDFIRNNSEKNLILHLELSSKSKLVHLLEKIGAKKSESFYYYRNHLPWYLKPFAT